MTLFAVSLLPLGTLALVLGAVVYFKRKIRTMSIEFDTLKSDIAEAAKELTANRVEIVALKTERAQLEADKAALSAQVVDLTAQLAAAQAAAGTTDAALAELDAELKPALDAAAEPATEAPPVAT